MKKIALVLVVLLFVLTSCTINGHTISIPTQGINGSGDIVTEEREVSGFTKVDLQSIGDLTIVEGAQESLTIKADDNLMEYITTKVEGDTLEIGMEPTFSFNPSRTIEYTLTVKSLSSVVLSGFGNITADKLSGDDVEVKLMGSGDISLGELEGTDLLLRISGFGDINVDSIAVEKPTLEITGSGDINVDTLEAEELGLRISGFGNADLVGTTNTQKIEIIGSGNYNAADLVSESADVKITGFGDATVNASDNLEVSITGSGDINYYGNPHVTQTITGFGEVNSQGDR